MTKNEKQRKYRKSKTGVLHNSYYKQKGRRKVDYSVNELINKFIDDKRYNRLYNEWVKSGFNQKLRPIVDRIDCRKNYTLSNIHILTRYENGYKQKMENKLLGVKPVKVIYFNGEEIVYNSHTALSIDLNMHMSTVSNIISGANRNNGSKRGIKQMNDI